MQEVDANKVIQKLLDQNQQLTMQVAVLQVQLEELQNTNVEKFAPEKKRKEG